MIDVAEKFEFGAYSIRIVEDVGRGSFLFPTYLGKSKETLFSTKNPINKLAMNNRRLLIAAEFHFVHSVEKDR